MAESNPLIDFLPCEGDDGRPVASLLGPLTSPGRQSEVSKKHTVLGAACFGDGKVIGPFLFWVVG